MALPPNISVNGTMHRRKSSKEEDDDNVALAFPASGQSPPKTAPLSQGFNLNGSAFNGGDHGGLAPPSGRSRVTSTPPAISVSHPPSQPASAGPYRTSFNLQRPPTNGAPSTYGLPNGRHQAPAMRQSFSLPSAHAHSRTRSISGPFSPITPSPLSASFPAQQLAMPSPHKMTTSSTAPELHRPTSLTESAPKAPPNSRRHARIHSRNLSVYFPRPGSLPASSIAEDGSQELDFGSPPPDEGVPIPSASPGPGQRTFREGFTFGGRPPASAPAAPPMQPSTSNGASRRGHHHKHSLSHNFFSFLEPGAQSPPSELHTQPTPVPVSPWAPISPFPGAQSGYSLDEKTIPNGRPATSAKRRAKSPVGRIRASPEISRGAAAMGAWQFVLGAWLWITGQQVGSLSCTGLGYWVVFDAFGVALGHILPNYLARVSMRSDSRRPYGCVRPTFYLFPR